MKFWDVFEEELAKSVQAKPADYSLQTGDTPQSYANRTRLRMQQSGMKRCNYDSITFRHVAKRFGVKPTRTELQRMEMEFY